MKANRILQSTSKLFILIFIFSFFFASSNLINAESNDDNSIGVSPGGIYNDKLLPGNSFRQLFVISRSNPTSDAKAQIDFEPQSLSKYIVFDNSLIDLPVGQQRVETYATVTIPSDFPVKDAIYGSAYVKLIKENSGQVTVLPAVKLDINLTTTNSKLSLLKILYSNIETLYLNSPLVLKLKVANDGNTPDNIDRITIEVQNLKKQSVKFFEKNNLDEIKEFSIKELSVLFENPDLKPDDYFAVITAYNNDTVIYNSTIAFNSLNEVSSVDQNITNSNGANIAVIVLIGLAIIFATWFLLFRKKKKKKTLNFSFEKPNAFR